MKANINCSKESPTGKGLTEASLTSELDRTFIWFLRVMMVVIVVITLSMLIHDIYLLNAISSFN